MAMTTQAEPIRVYWRPHCSSCMRLKEFLNKRGIPFVSINCQEQPAELDKLIARGIMGFPVVARGDDYAYGQYLEDAAAFLGLGSPSRSVLSAPQIVEKMFAILEGAIRFTRQLPDELIVKDMPGRGLTYGNHAYHIFRIVESFLIALDTGYLSDENILGSIPATMPRADEIAAYGQSVLGDSRAWWSSAGEFDPTRPMKTDYGVRPVLDALERTVWHAGQHTRQIEAVVVGFNIPVDGPLPASLFEGLPTPEDALDKDAPPAAPGPVMHPNHAAG
jgi:glutaredoxin